MSIWKAEPQAEVRRMDRSTFMDALIERLHKELYERDYNIKSLAVDCELTCEEISGILRKKRKEIRLSTLFKISNGLGMNTSALLASIEESKGGING